MVLPLPVGPTVMIAPYGRAIARRTIASVAGSMPSSRIERAPLTPPWRIRSTACSPKVVGSTATRRSIGWPPTLMPMRPSCGMRRCAMSRPPITFRRASTAACIEVGVSLSSRVTPSMRTLTTSRLAWGTKWMSEAR